MSRPGGITDSEVLRAILASGNVRVTLMDREGRFLLDPDPNPPLPSDSGAPPNSSLLELYSDVPGLPEAIRACFAGETVKLVRQREGVGYRTTFLPRRTATGEVDSIFAVATVVHEPGLVEQALTELQARERRIFDSTMVGLLYWDQAGAITEANDAFLNLVGYSRAEVAQGKLDWVEMTPPKYRHLDAEALVQIASTGSCVPFEKQYVRKDGQPVDVLVGGSIWQVGSNAGVAFVVDISERKRSEQVRREAEETLRRVVEAVPIVLWSVDLNGTFTLSTGRGLQALGLQSGQVVGQSVYELYAGVPVVLDCVRRCLSGEQLTETVEVGELVFESLFTPLRDENGAVNGLLGVAIDVTERRRAEHEQQRLRAQLLQVQKLESLGLLAGGIAHDFNNILTPILGASSSALLTIPKENPAYQDIEMVIAAAQRAANLTRQMLAYSGKAHVEMRPLDLSRHVREIASLLETTVSKKVKLRLELEGSLPSVCADVAQLQQIVMNLVINGAEAIGDQPGTVLVSTGKQRLDDAYIATLFAAEGLTSGDYAFVEVHDTGHGMDDATKEKIFDPFFTTKFTGRGLGLAAVLGIVRSHHGAIKVYSSPGRGTSFKVFFPTAEQAPVSETRRPASDFRGDGLVLLIDDDRSVRLTARRMLEYFGFTVIDAEDGQAGVELFRERAAELALVICDMTMPKLNGEETVRALRVIRSDVPVILTSGYNELEATRRFMSKGLAGFLEKPFSTADLMRKLQAVLRRETK